MGNVLSMCDAGGWRLGVEVDDLRDFAAILENELALMMGEVQRVSVSHWMICTNAGPHWNELRVVDLSFLVRIDGALCSLQRAKFQLAESLMVTSPTSFYEVASQRPSLPLQNEVMEPRNFQAENPTLQSDAEELKRALQGLKAEMQEMTGSHETKTTQLLTQHAAQMEKLKEEHQSMIVKLKKDLSKGWEQVRNQWNRLNELKMKSAFELKEVRSAREVLLKEREALLIQNKLLQEQIGKLEVKGGRQCGSYRECMPTPNDMQLLAYKIKESLASFTKTVMYSEGGLLKDVDVEVAVDCTKPLTPPELKMERSSDIKFCYQRIVSETVFFGFEAEDFQIPGCDSEEMEVDKRRTDSYMQYHELKNSMSPGNDSWAMMGKPEELTVSVCSGASNQATRGQDRFLAFRQKKTQQIMTESRVGKLLSARNGEERIIALRRSLDQMLRDVWLFHLLAFSFDPPSSIFKVKVGSVFDSAYMGSVRDEEKDSNAVRRVAFMIVPGFRIGKAVVRAHVFTVN